MRLTTSIVYAPMQSIDSSTFTGSYTTFGLPFPVPPTILKLVNNSTSLVTISVDGMTDNDVLPPNSFFLYDLTGNSPPNTEGVFITTGTQLYIKGAAGTGFVYLVYKYILPTRNPAFPVIA